MAIEYLQSNVVDLFDVWAARTPEATAVEWDGRTLTYAALRDASLHVSRSLLSTGVAPGDMVPVLSQMSLELVPAILGILRVGACYVTIDTVAWSTARIEATLEDLSPRVAIATGQPNTRSVQVMIFFPELWLRSPFVDTDDTCGRLHSIRRRLDKRALVYVCFTSGTTGKPKGVMIYHRALYDFVASATRDTLMATPGERVLLAFSISFDGLAATVWTTVTRGGTVVMASSSTFPEVSATCDTLILSPSMFAALDPAGPYEKVSKIYLGAEAANLDIARQWTTPRRKVIHTYGPSETTLVVSFGTITEASEPSLGEFRPGVDIYLVDENLQESDVGEILIGGPSVGAGYLNNPELTAKKFIQWNGKPVYRTGDLAKRSKRGLSFIGRVDRMVKNRGFLVNLESDVEPAMLRFPGVRVASAFMWRGKLIGFVQPAVINLETLHVFLRDNFDPFVVPDEILTVDQIPLTAHGKVDRAALHAQLENRMANAEENLSSMVCDSAYDALRWAFAKCLQVPLRELDSASSFSRLGGNSLAAIRFTKLLAQQGYMISVPEVLRGDTIAHLAEKITRMIAAAQNGVHESDDGAPPPTDMHRLMLTQSQSNPAINCVVVRAKFTGGHDSDSAPTPGELRDAWFVALAAHSVFTTRYDMENWTLHELEHVNLDWKEVSSSADDFDHTLLRVEEQVWTHQKGLPSVELQVPYCHMTCVYAPERKAIGFVWRLHHVLIDPLSFEILMRDLERALAGKAVRPGPRIQDYACFMQRYKRDQLGRATEFWDSMLKPLSELTVFRFRPPPTPLASFKGRSEAWTSLRFTTRQTLASVDAAVRAHGISSATLIFSAWALALHHFTRSSHVSFGLSRSGRMVPWPQAGSLVAAMNCRVAFATPVPLEQTVHGWLAEMHGKLLGAAELENLCQSLDSSRYRSEYFNTGVQAYLHMPAPPARWDIHDKITGQAGAVAMVWKVQQSSSGNGAVEAELEVDQRAVDVGWAQEVGTVAVQMLEGLANAKKGAELRSLCSAY